MEPITSRPSSAPGAVPANFGAPNGTPIDNATQVLEDLFTRLNATRPTPRTGAPDVMLIFVEPYNTRQITGAWGLGPNGLGHAAIAYTLAGKTEVMNIVGSGDPAMVNFLSLPEYLFGVDKFKTGCEQGGVYNRSIRMVALWDVPAEQVQKLALYYRTLKAQSTEPATGRTAKFAMAPAFSNAISALTGRDETHGNCSIYTSRGLREAGLMEHACTWPKELFVRAMKKKSKTPDNVSIISLPRIAHAQMTLGAGPGNAGLTGFSLNPVKWVRSNWKYWRLSDFADAEVFVPAGSIHAEVRLKGNTSTQLSRK